MQRGVIVGAAAAIVMAVGVVAGAMALGNDDGDNEPVKVVFGETDGLPKTLAAGADYRAAFIVEWHGPVAERDGKVSVFASRKGDTTEDAPEDGWPVVCESEFDDVVSHSRLACQFKAPGPGDFALLLEVRSAANDEVIGEGIYPHNVVDPEATSGDDG